MQCALPNKLLTNCRSSAAYARSPPHIWLLGAVSGTVLLKKAALYSTCSESLADEDLLSDNVAAAEGSSSGRGCEF